MLNNCIFADVTNYHRPRKQEFIHFVFIMTIAKEKIKLKNLLIPLTPIEEYSEADMEILDDCYRQYSTIIKVLFKTYPNVFANLYNHDLREIKDNKKFVKESFSDQARQNNFVVYKESIEQAIDRTLSYIVDYLPH